MSQVKKFHIPCSKVQKRLKDSLMQTLWQSAGLKESNLGGVSFKVTASDMKGSTATVTVYETGSVLVVGEGAIYDLTCGIVSLYYRGIPHIDFTANARSKKVVTARRKTRTP